LSIWLLLAEVAQVIELVVVVVVGVFCLERFPAQWEHIRLLLVLAVQVELAVVLETLVGLLP
jgi:hypothetical protein